MTSKIIVKYGHYVAGWLDNSVHHFLLEMPTSLSSVHYSLITCLDSNREVGELLETSEELRIIAPEAKVLGQGVLLPTNKLIQFESSNRIMFGFDEIFFFPNAVIRPKPTGPGLVGPRRINQERMDALGEWMQDSACSLAIGDGDGLNCILQARGLVGYFVSNSIQQPEHTNIS